MVLPGGKKISKELFNLYFASVSKTCITHRYLTPGEKVRYLWKDFNSFSKTLLPIYLRLEK